MWHEWHAACLCMVGHAGDVTRSVLCVHAVQCRTCRHDLHHGVCTWSSTWQPARQLFDAYAVAGTCERGDGGRLVKFLPLNGPRRSLAHGKATTLDGVNVVAQNPLQSNSCCSVLPREPCARALPWPGLTTEGCSRFRTTSCSAPDPTLKAR